MINLQTTTNVELNAAFNPMLEDLQANIIKHHGRHFAFHLFVKFTNKAQAKTWIKNFAATKIVSGRKQIEDSMEHSRTGADGGVVCNLSLSKFGYTFLEKTDKMPDDDAFKAGLKDRTALVDDDKSKWEAEFRNDIHCLIIVADNSEATATNEKNAIIAQISGFANIIKVQRGKVLKNGDIGIEHFGYADGISQPIYLKEEIQKQGTRNHWDDTAFLDKLLIKDTGGATENSFGSLLVFRKLEQNVKAFKAAEATLPVVNDRTNVANPELAGAMVVGRFEDGTAVVSRSKEKGNTKNSQLKNDFNYGTDPEGSRCPFHSHIRLTNPRNDVGDFAKEVRITRRGIPFDDFGRNENDLDNDQPEGDVGLLFMCYQSNIARQFEFIQKTWVNDGDIGGTQRGQDGIIGQGANAFQKELPARWGRNTNMNPCAFSNPMSQFVKMKGGEYFFTPSISFLRNL